MYEIIEDFEKNQLTYTNKMQIPNIDRINNRFDSIEEKELILIENPFNKIIKEDIIFIRKICSHENYYFLYS